MPTPDHDIIIPGAGLGGIGLGCILRDRYTRRVQSDA